MALMEKVDLSNVLKIPPRFAYLNGCEKCRNGRIFATGDRQSALMESKAIGHMTLPQQDVFLWGAGFLKFCECEAGLQAQRTTEHQVLSNEKTKAQFAADVAAVRQRRLSRIFDSAQVPPRFASLTMASFVAIAGAEDGKRAAIKAVREYYEKGQVSTPRGPRFGIMLWGKSDMGKTGILSPLFLHYVRNGNAGLWVQYNDLLASLRQFESGNVEERIRTAQMVDYLFIDDFGDPSAEKSATDYTRDVVFRVLDYRNNYQKPTFITSNLHPEKMDRQFHERTVKRLAELCAIVEVNGDSMRYLMEHKEWDAAQPA